MPIRLRSFASHLTLSDCLAFWRHCSHCHAGQVGQIGGGRGRPLLLVGRRRDREGGQCHHEGVDAGQGGALQDRPGLQAECQSHMHFGGQIQFDDSQVASIWIQLIQNLLASITATVGQWAWLAAWLGIGTGLTQ